MIRLALHTALRSAAVLASALSLNAAALVLYVGPQGIPAAGGLTQDDSISDLQTAMDKGLARVGEDEILELRVLAGTYRGQQVKLRTPNPAGGGIVLVGDSKQGHPVFDGGGLDAPWLTVSTADGPTGRLSVFGLEIRGYATAITLNGSRDDDGRSITDIVIRNNIFRSIGQISKSQKEPSTAVVRLVNADRVQIINNRFQDIRNRQTCSRLHAVYIAHGSTDNLVQGNVFQEGCGDAIRFRDRSSGNRVLGNVFIDFWVDAPISDWYCDSTLTSRCTKTTPECPSFDNEIADNRIEARRLTIAPVVRAFGADHTHLCPLPTSERSSEHQRFLLR